MRINYVAVLVCGLLYWLLGAVWYGVLFGMRWMALEGITMAQAQKSGAPVAYVVSFLLGLLMAYVLAHVCAWRNVRTASGGASMGVLMWIGFIGPVTFTTNMFEGRPKMLFAINSFYPLVGLWIMGIVLGLWKRKPA
jgi:uncharacterized protein DUF1761